jgi:hypothetical protein
VVVVVAVRSINLSGHKEIVSAHHSGINSLQVRYSADFLVQNSFVGEIGTLVHLISGLSEIFRSFF